MLPAGTMLMRSRLLGQVEGVLHAFTTRRLGVSHPPYDSLNMGLLVGDDPNAVIENRRRAVAALGFTLDAWVSGEQVHGTRIIRVTADDKGKGALRHDDAVRESTAWLRTLPVCSLRDTSPIAFPCSSWILKVPAWASRTPAGGAPWAT